MIDRDPVVPPKQRTIPTVTGALMTSMRQALGERVAAMNRPVYGNEDVPPSEQRALFWQEAEGWTPEHEAQLVLSGMPSAQVEMLKYPNREKLAKSGGRIHLEQQVRYLRQMGRLGPPDPEGLEKLAREGSDGQPSAPDAAGMAVGRPGLPDGGLPGPEQDQMVE